MAYPFRKMTTRDLKERYRDNRYGERNQKSDPESRPTHDRKNKSQEDVCKN